MAEANGSQRVESSVPAVVEKPRVSVIVLGFNGRQYVDGCLASLRNQRFDEPFEVIFVDNGSKDGTADEAAKHDWVRVERLDKNYGFCLGNNKGFERARGEYVIFLNQDVIVHRDWLKEMVAAMDLAPSIKAGHANIIHPWNPEFAAHEVENPVYAAYSPELSRLGFIEYRSASPQQQVVDTLFLSGASTILKRDVLDEIGGYVFDPGMFLYGEDMDLGLRIRSAGYRTVACTRAVVYHDHTLNDEVSLKAVVKVTRIIRNRLIAFWKSSTWAEFSVLATITMLGSPFNSGQFGLPLKKRILYAFALVPPTMLAGLAFWVAVPRFAGRRREILNRRKLTAWWLPKTLLLDRKSLTKAPAAFNEAA
ncbi:MAG: glycosyltransferase family 2 protein [Dehalococcoidia bacterium]